MPTLQSYARLAPFSLEELVTAVNSILRDRPALEVQARTIRYYVSKGIIPPPGGSPKFARYELTHLLGVVSTRVLQDQGIGLEAAKSLIATQSIDEVQLMVETPADRQHVSEQMAREHQPRLLGETVTRLHLTEGVTLEIASHLDQSTALELAAAAIRVIHDSR